jgi:hypothetical protein
VTQIASTSADLVAQEPDTISQTKITDIMRAASFIMAPYTQNPLQIVVREVQTSPASATVAKQSWTCTYNGTGSSLTCSCTNVASTLPVNLANTNDAVVVATSTYAYRPLVFDYFMKKNYVATGGTYILSETIYLKPRGQWPMLLQSNGTKCPSPTFP